MTRAEYEIEFVRLGIECETRFHVITSSIARHEVRFRREGGEWNCRSTKFRHDDIDETAAEFAARIERDILADLERALKFYRERP